MTCDMSFLFACLRVLCSGRISPESLHSPMSTKEDPPLHPVSVDTVGYHVLFRLLSLGLREDGLPCNNPAPSPSQVSFPLTAADSSFPTHVSPSANRHKIVTYIIDAKYLDALDGEHQ